MVIPFRKILWVKSVSLDPGEMAYAGRIGREFELHCSPDDMDSLGDPEVGDLIVLIQHEQATHLVEVVGAKVQERPRRTIKKGSRDERFTMQRTCRHVLLGSFEEAPFVEQAFGIEPAAEGGETLAIEELPAIVNGDQPLWMVQRRVLNALQGPSVRTLYVTRRERQDDGMPQVDLREFLQDRDPD